MKVAFKFVSFNYVCSCEIEKDTHSYSVTTSNLVCVCVYVYTCVQVLSVYLWPFNILVCISAVILLTFTLYISITTSSPAKSVFSVNYKWQLKKFPGKPWPCTLLLRTSLSLFACLRLSHGIFLFRLSLSLSSLILFLFFFSLLFLTLKTSERGWDEKEERAKTSPWSNFLKVTQTEVWG